MCQGNLPIEVLSLLAIWILITVCFTGTLDIGTMDDEAENLAMFFEIVDEKQCC